MGQYAVTQHELIECIGKDAAKKLYAVIDSDGLRITKSRTNKNLLANVIGEKAAERLTFYYCGCRIEPLPDVIYKDVDVMLRQGYSLDVIARKLGKSKRTIYRILKCKRKRQVERL